MTIDIVRSLMEARAHRAGCIVRRVFRTYEYEMGPSNSPFRITHELHSRLWVEEKLCVLSALRVQAPRKEGAYTRFSFATLTCVEAVLINLALDGYPERAFVVPARLLREALFEDNATRELMRFLVPATERQATKCPRINLWPYLDAWSLLKTNSAQAA